MTDLEVTLLSALSYADGWITVAQDGEPHQYVHGVVQRTLQEMEAQ